MNDRFNKYERYFTLLEDKFKPNPTEKQIQVAEKLLPVVEDLLYKKAEQVAEEFLNNNSFREYMLSKIPPEEMAKAKKLAKEQNTTIDEILKQKLVEILRNEKN